jgi:cell division protein ZapA
MAMVEKTDTEVIIGGKVFTLSGYESEEYLQKVALYINNMIADYNKMDAFKRAPLDQQNVLIQLNIADDYFKAKKQIEVLEEQVKEKEKELYDIKHELIAAQIKLENTEKNVKSLEENLSDDSKKIIQMETELKNLKRR